MCDELDAHLKKLALEAQSHSRQSSSRQIALTKLVMAIQKSRKLYPPPRLPGDYNYEEIYHEAKQRLFFFICDRIDQYDPARGEVLQWVNSLLRERFVRETRRDPCSPPKRIVPTLIDLENIETWYPNSVMVRENPSLLDEIRQYIQEDPEELFRATHAKDNPQANFQFLVQRILAGYKWKEISAELNIPPTTLSSFYQRSLRRFLPQFKAYFS